LQTGDVYIGPPQALQVSFPAKSGMVTAPNATNATIAIAAAIIIQGNEYLTYGGSAYIMAISFTLVPVKPVNMSEFNFLKA
jgi:hypothetical protein